MIGASKILTVSYGTFSCTLEGFEDPFSTMRQIAEYFRDLAADDRYFGCEPPVPDAAMLQQIAERSQRRRVSAEMQEHGLVLRAERGDARPPEAMPEAARAPLTETAPEVRPEPESAMPSRSSVVPMARPGLVAVGGDGLGSVSDKLLRLRAAAEEPWQAAPDDIDAAFAEDEMQPGTAEEVAEEAAATPEFAESVLPVASEETGGDAVGQMVADAAEDAKDEADSDALITSVAEAIFEDAPLAEASSEAEEAERHVPEAADWAEVEPDVAEVEMPEWDSGRPTEAIEGTEAWKADEAQTAEADHSLERAEDEAIAEMMAVPEVEAEAEVEAVSEPEAVSGAEVAWESEADSDVVTAAGAEAEPEAEVEAVAEPEAEVAAEGEPEAEVAPEAETAEAATPDREPGPAARFALRARARLARLSARRTAEESTEEAITSEVEAPADMGEAEVSAAETPLSSEDEADLQAELAALRFEEDRAEADLAVATFEEDRAEADLAAALDTSVPFGPAEHAPEAAEVEGVTTTEAPAGETDDADADHDAPAHSERPRFAPVDEVQEQQALQRLMETADTKLQGSETVRKLNAFQQLKAAVAATFADRQARDETPVTPQAEPSEAYRDDLREATRPRRPQPNGEPGASRRPESPRPATPLVLVSEQRIDRPQAARPVDVGGIRPRRVLRDSFPGEDRRLAEQTPEAGDSFRDFAERIGAVTLSDLLEAAAAYTAHIEGRTRFSRAQVMSKIARLKSDDSDGFSREEGLRSFGKLLRTGRIRRVQDGQFVISEESRFVQEARTGTD